MKIEDLGGKIKEKEKNGTKSHKKCSFQVKNLRRRNYLPPLFSLHKFKEMRGGRGLVERQFFRITRYLKIHETLQEIIAQIISGSGLCL